MLWLVSYLVSIEHMLLFKHASMPLQVNQDTHFVLCIYIANIMAIPQPSSLYIFIYGETNAITRNLNSNSMEDFVDDSSARKYSLTKS